VAQAAGNGRREMRRIGRTKCEGIGFVRVESE